MNIKLITYIFSAIIILIIGSYLRLDGVEKVYYEYDDVGVVALQKSFVGDNYVNIGLGPFEKLKINNEYLKKIETTPYYGFYIAKAWTYAPGQYFLASIFLNDKQSDVDKISFIRYISAIASILFLVLIVVAPIILYEKWSDGSLAFVLLTAICATSLNSIAYAAHAGPYSMYMFTMGLGLMVVGVFNRGYFTRGGAIALLNILFIFNYLIIFITICFIAFELLRSIVDKNFKMLFKTMIEMRVLITTIPIIFLLIIINSDVPRGVLPPSINDTNVYDYILYLFNRFSLVSESIFVGGVNGHIASSIIFIALAYGFLKIKSWFICYCYLPMISFLIILFWTILHLIGKFPMDQTRHSLILLPCILFLFNYFLRDLIEKSNQLIAYLFTFVFVSMIIFHGIGSASSYKMARTAVMLDKDSMKIYNPDYILTYGSTLAPLIQFENEKSIKVFYLDISNVKKINWSEIDPESKILLVSQDIPLTKNLIDSLSADYPILFENSCIIQLLEINTGIYFPYNSYPMNSGQNGAYIYSLRIGGC